MAIYIFIFVLVHFLPWRAFLLFSNLCMVIAFLCQLTHGSWLIIYVNSMFYVHGLEQFFLWVLNSSLEASSVSSGLMGQTLSLLSTDDLIGRLHLAKKQLIEVGRLRSFALCNEAVEVCCSLTLLLREVWSSRKKARKRKELVCLTVIFSLVQVTHSNHG